MLWQPTRGLLQPNQSWRRPQTPAGGAGIVTVNTTGTKQYSGSTPVTAFNYTGITVAAGSNTALTYSVNWDTNTASPIAIAAIWDSGSSNQSMTKLVERFEPSQPPYAGVTIFGLRNPTPGNKTLRMTWTNNSRAFGVGMAWDGVNLTSDATAFPHTQTGIIGAGATLSVTSAVGNKVTLSGCSPGQSFSGVTGTTIYTDSVSAQIIWAWANYDNGAATTVIGNTNNGQTMAAVDISAV